MPPRRKPVKPPAKPAPAAAAAQAVVADNGAVPGENRYLPKKEAELFRQVLTLYETKEYKTGLQLVEQILETHPEHGESLCMKGLFLCCLDRKPEGYDLVKLGVKNDMGSHIVWHVYAIVLRADKNFDEALKCYKKACEIEKDSLNLLTDLSTLTIHLRHYADYVQVRRSILRTQPRLRRNWLALAVAQYLAQQYTDACATLTYYENMLREVPSGDVEHSEVLLFHAMCLEEAGEYEKCLEFLGEKSGEIVDRSAYSVQRARLLLKVGRSEPALWAWELLLEENPESTEYIKATVQAKGADCDSTTEEGRSKAVAILDELAEKYPRSLAIRRLALDLTSGDVFRSKASTYLLNALSKGVPSVFADIKALYVDQEKQRIVGEIVEAFRKGLEEKGAIVTEEAGDDQRHPADDTVESPSTYLWTLYFLSQHYSSLTPPQHSHALSILALASAHTPSLPELPMLRARILKRAGDAQGAAKAMEEARQLDGQDRFLNCKASKYAIRAAREDEAERIAGLFTKKDAPSPLEDLVEMQCLWFLQEEGDSYLRQQKWGLALKRYTQILDIFQEIEEDQYDFHAYCMRKSTLRAYIEMLRFEDKVRDHARFAAAAKGAIEAPAPLNVYVDADPQGLKLLATETPLDDALKFLKPLERARPREVQTWVLSFEVALRRGGASFLLRLPATASAHRAFDDEMCTGKYLDALRALRTALSLAPTSPALLPLVVRLKIALQAPPALDSALLAVLNSETAALLGGDNIEGSQFVEEQLRKHSKDAEWVLKGAEAWVALGRKDEAEKLAARLVEEELGATLAQTARAFAFLQSHSSSQLEPFRVAAATRFPLARVFKTQVELAELDKQSEEAVEDGEKENVE
ncbi:SPOSA6832_02667, partial [Sporobolomyces salmonicolor]